MGSAIRFPVGLVWKQEGLALLVGHQSLHSGHFTQTWCGQGVSRGRKRLGTRLSCPWELQDVSLASKFASMSLKRTGVFHMPTFPHMLELGTLCSPSSLKWLFDFPFLFITHVTLLVYPEPPTPEFCGGQHRLGAAVGQNNN